MSTAAVWPRPSFFLLHHEQQCTVHLLAVLAADSSTDLLSRLLPLMVVWWAWEGAP